MIYRSASGELFRLLRVTGPLGDEWAHYRRESTGVEYSCRLEAFLQRFWESTQ
jgi:hypothetical protein